MNIYEKMSAITNELKTIQKNLTIRATQNSSYKAVGEVDILDAVKPLEKKYGVYSYPSNRRILESHLIDNSTIFKDSKTGNETVTKKTSYMTRIETTYLFVNIEKPDEFVQVISFSEGIDTSDKGSGKAMSYGDKYALMKAYKISTGDDVPPAIPTISQFEVLEIQDIFKAHNELNEEKFLQHFNIKEWESLDVQQYDKFMDGIRKRYPNYNTTTKPQTASAKEVEQLQAINSRVGVKK